MDKTESLTKLLRSFETYYDINRENPVEPFAAQAEFSLHDEQYFLVRSARISEADTKEFVYFATEDLLDQEKLEELDRRAWEDGTGKVKPHKDHRNSDVILIILADQIDQEAFALIPKLRHYKSYRHGLYGWSHYKLAAIELASGRTAANRQGRDLRKLISDIL
ncbi:MAG: hypothetical protein LUH58_04680 [Lachnospiraceae bacterium]|nr:hypothetical protein [Lachnospiraceae bacterium]